jgi:hypothetical protein
MIVIPFEVKQAVHDITHKLLFGVKTEPSGHATRRGLGNNDVRHETTFARPQVKRQNIRRPRPAHKSTVENSNPPVIGHDDGDTSAEEVEAARGLKNKTLEATDREQRMRNTA